MLLLLLLCALTAAAPVVPRHGSHGLPDTLLFDQTDTSYSTYKTFRFANKNTTLTKARKRSAFRNESVKIALDAFRKGDNVTDMVGDQKVPLTDDAFASFEITVYTNIAVLIFCLVIFGTFQWRCPHVFTPRYTHGVASDMVPPVRGCLSWVRHSLSITNDHIFRHAGLDALSLVMLVELGLQLFVVFMVLNVSILVFGFRRWSMNSICYGSPKLWGHYILATLMILALMWLVHHHWHEFSKYRRRYLERLRTATTTSTRKQEDVEEHLQAKRTIPLLALHGRSVMLEGLPEWLYLSANPDKALYDFFNVLFPGQIDSAVLARDPGVDLTTLLQERDEIRDRLERAMSARQECLASDPAIDEPKYPPPILLANAPKTCCRCCFRAVGRVPAAEDNDNNDVTQIVGVRRELDVIESKLHKLVGDQWTIDRYEVYTEMTGYVVFTTVAGKSMATQALLTTPWENMVKRTQGVDNAQQQSAPDILVRSAPEPRDLVHNNVGSRQLRIIGGCLSIRVALLRMCNVLLLFFWAAPVALISSFTQLDELEKHFPWIKPLIENSVLRGYLQGFLPTLAIIVFMAILPYIFSFLARAEGMTRESDIAAAATSRYVVFQIINVLFVSAFAGGMWETLDSVIHKPGAVIDLLGTAIPDTYFFFTSYITLLAFSIYPIELCQFVPLFTKSLYLGRTKTLREWRQTARPPPITGGYAKQYGYVLLSFAITMEFATVAPMLLPFGVLFFGFGYVILRHHVYYVYDTPYDGEGRIFQWTMGVLCVLAVIVLLTLIGIFYQRKSPVQATLLWPLVFVVVLFYWYEESKHVRSFETLSLQDMKVNDSSEQDGGKIQVEVTSRHYAWMLSNDEVEDSALREGVALDVPAAYAYLHPDILRSRLGKISLITDAEEKENARVLDYKKSTNFFEEARILQIEQECNVLYMPRRRKGATPKTRAETKAQDAAQEEVGNIEGGALVEEDEEEEVVGGIFLFRSRWLLWLWSQILATMFIGGIFYFYHTHQANTGIKCIA
jgi:hypothetical protein